jgi:hypothetical protein
LQGQDASCVTGLAIINGVAIVVLVLEPPGEADADE